MVNRYYLSQEATRALLYGGDEGLVQWSCVAVAVTELTGSGALRACKTTGSETVPIGAQTQYRSEMTIDKFGVSGCVEMSWYCHLVLPRLSRHYPCFRIVSTKVIAGHPEKRL